MISEFDPRVSTAESSLSTETRKMKVQFKCLVPDSTPVFLTGDAEEMGHWDLSAAIETQMLPPTPDGYECLAQVELPMGHTIEYKFVRKDAGQAHWESGMNRRITVIPGLHSLEADFRG
jgi:hypothetical protein